MLSFFLFLIPLFLNGDYPHKNLSIENSTFVFYKVPFSYL